MSFIPFHIPLILYETGAITAGSLNLNSSGTVKGMLCGTVSTTPGSGDGAINFGITFDSIPSVTLPKDTLPVMG